MQTLKDHTGTQRFKDSLNNIFTTTFLGRRPKFRQGTVVIFYFSILMQNTFPNFDCLMFATLLIPIEVLRKFVRILDAVGCPRMP